MAEDRKNVLQDLFIVPDFNGSRINVSAAAPIGCTGVSWQVRENGRVAAEATTAPVKNRIAFSAALPGFRPWTVNSPFLYELVLHLAYGDAAVEHRQLFGMRKFHVEGTRIFMNNQPFFIRGFIRGREAHEHPNLIGVSTSEYYAKNIRMAKTYGFNFVRFHSAVPPEEFFREADRLGILVHVEMRKYRGKYQKRDEADLSYLDEDAWREMILRVRNHPSLMVYCIGNEVDNPGNNPAALRIRDLVKQLDPTRLFLDTCSRGEFDRTTVDLDVQHMSYFCPFGRHDHMFEDTQNIAIYGSVTGRKMVETDDENNPHWTVRREVLVPRPLIAHETGHYIAHHDLTVLEKKFGRYKDHYIKYHDDHVDGKPWWLPQLQEMVRSKGLEKDYPKILTASRRFQFIWWKQVFERVRTSPILSGFHFLQLADTERHENTNGLLDCFDDPKYLPPEEFLAFNSDDVVVAHLPRRTFFERETLFVPVFFSHYSDADFSRCTLRWSLRSKGNDTVSLAGKMEDFYVAARGLHKLCSVEIRLPEAASAQSLIFSLELASAAAGKSPPVTNKWNLWLFPNRPERVPALRITSGLEAVQLRRRYPQIRLLGNFGAPEKLYISRRFSDDMLNHLENGGDAVVFYRIPENRDRKADKEKFYLPSTRDRFKGVIWDRGHNLGGFIRSHAALGDFPHDGFIDFQFYHLIDDCDKISLDEFPVPLDPIIQGVDKGVRDRFDVFKFQLLDLVPAYTLRKFAYLFELRVGKGRLLVSAFNFTGVNNDVPESCYLLEQLLRYVTSESFQPKHSLPLEELRRLLREKGRSPRIKERMMTQYWQLDDAPLESKKFWQESEAYLREKE